MKTITHSKETCHENYPVTTRVHCLGIKLCTKHELKRGTPGSSLYNSDLIRYGRGGGKNIGQNKAHKLFVCYNGKRNTCIYQYIPYSWKFSRVLIFAVYANQGETAKFYTSKMFN